jgi:hypothetical protein
VSELITRTARLVPYAKRPKQVPSFVTAYSYEPMPDGPAVDLGSLFVVIEVLVGGRSSEEVADLIIETIGNHYYNQANSEQTDPLERFESAIKAANHELTEYVNQGNAAWIGKLSAVVAIQAGSDFHLAQTGSAEAFLYRGKAAARISGQAPARPAVPSKTFGSIASGGLETGDRILLATPALVHQVALTKLKGIVSETSPENAIAEITELLRGSVSDRIAALIMEITTPEQAALQMRSDAPNEIQLGSPENVVEAAKMAAAPLAQATVNSGKRAGEVAKRGWERSRPHLHRMGMSAVGALRSFLTGRGARKRLVIVGALLVIGLAGFWWWQQSTVRTNQLLERYKTDYRQYQLAEQAVADGDKTGARILLQRLQNELKELDAAPGRASLDAKLPQTALSEGAPIKVSAFLTLVTTRLDALEGLKHAQITTVVSFAEFKNSQPSHMELTATKAYVFDAKNNSALYVVNLATNTIKKSGANTARLGTIKATTLASTGDGIYILTAGPSVWFYRFDTDTLTEQAVGLGQWPAAKALASYAGNLYLLGEDVIYKHLRTLGGFSTKSTYLSGTPTNGLKESSAMAIDGSVYVLTPVGVRQYLAGALTATAEVPESLRSITSLHAPAGADLLIGAAGSSKRVGLWSTDQKVTFVEQYELGNIGALYDVGYDAKSKTVYALVDGRLVKFTRL